MLTVINIHIRDCFREIRFITSRQIRYAYTIEAQGRVIKLSTPFQFYESLSAPFSPPLRLSPRGTRRHKESDYTLSLGRAAND